MSKSVMILSGVRTAIGTFGGSLSGIAPTDLAVRVAAEAVSRSGLEAAATSPAGWRC